MNENVIQLIANLSKNESPGRGEFLLLKEKIDFALDQDFENFIKTHNGAAGSMGEENYLLLWNVNEIMTLNPYYKEVEICKELFFFGSNGSSLGYAFEKVTGHVVSIYFMDIGHEPVTVIGFNFESFLAGLQIAMTNQEKTDNYYKAAVKGLTNIILHDKDLWYSYVLNLPRPEQIVYLIGTFNQQVLNGGLHQYFFNSYGQFAYLTLDALNQVGARETEKILDRALMAVNSENFSVEEFRAKIFNRRLDKIVNFDEALGDFLNKLSEEYDNSNEDLEALITNFLK